LILTISVEHSYYHSFLIRTKPRLIRALQNIYHLRRTGITSRIINIQENNSSVLDIESKVPVLQGLYALKIPNLVMVRVYKIYLNKTLTEHYRRMFSTSASYSWGLERKPKPDDYCGLSESLQANFLVGTSKFGHDHFLCTSLPIFYSL